MPPDAWTSPATDTIEAVAEDTRTAMPTTSASSRQGPRSPRGPFGPIDIALQADIRAPVEVVWSLLVDWDRMGRWMLEASGFRVKTEHREGVGVEVEAKIRIGGITTTDTVRVTRWEPPHVLAADHLGWVKGDAIMQCIPTERGTRLEWVERLAPPLGLLGAIGIRAFQPLMVRAFVRDLSVLTRLAETQAGARRPHPSSKGPGKGSGQSGSRGSADSANGHDSDDGHGVGEPGMANPSSKPARRRLSEKTEASRAESRSRPQDASRAESRSGSQPDGRSASSRPARAAEATTGPGPGTRGREAASLFARWFWLVYLPLALLAVVVLLVMAGLMPAGLRTPLLVLTGAWSALALVMLFERRRRHVAVRPPRRLVLAIAAVVLMAAAGALLTWVGIGKVSSSEGLAMLLVGCFFILMAVFAPMFKLVDSAFRLVARLLTRRSRSAGRAATSAPSGSIATSSADATPAPMPESGSTASPHPYT